LLRQVIPGIDKGLKRFETNMDCKSFDKVLIDFVEGELERSEAEAALKHLATCPYCSRDVEEYKEIKRILEDENPIKASPELLARISAAARGELAKEGEPFWRKWFYSPILVPVLSSVLALFIWVSYGQKNLDWFSSGKDIYPGGVLAQKLPVPEESILSAGKEEVQKDSRSEQTETLGRLSPASPPVFEKRVENQTSSPGSAPFKATKEKDEVSQYEVPSSSKSGSESGVGTEGSWGDEKSLRDDVLAGGSVQAERELKTTEGRNKQSDLASYQEYQYYARLNLALKQQNEGDCEQAIKTNEELLKTSPSPPGPVQAKAYLSLAECYEREGKWVEAISSYNNLQRVSPEQSTFAKNKIASILQKSYLPKSREASEPGSGEEGQQAK
jgi:tetratricopeptide (TPR) repeat protein